MLSSAHVLAMDAKNLLDVIDSIRINFPMVDQIITRSANVTASRSSVSTSGSVSASSSAASSLEKHREAGGGVRLGSCWPLTSLIKYFWSLLCMLRMRIIIIPQHQILLGVAGQQNFKLTFYHRINQL